MPVGIIVNALSVLFGGVLGMVFGNKVPEKFKTELIQIFGVCSMGMGISSIVLMKYMPAVVFSVVVVVSAVVVVSSFLPSTSSMLKPKRRMLTDWKSEGSAA